MPRLLAAVTTTLLVCGCALPGPALAAKKTYFRVGNPADAAAVTDRMPALVRRSLLEGGLPIPEGEDARYRAALPQMQRMLMAVRTAGVPFVAGTDAMPGFMLPRELELYVEAGLAAPEVLRIATLDAARLVVKDGALSDPDALCRALGIQPVAVAGR